MKKAIKYIITAIVLIILIPILFVSCVILISSFVNPDEVPSFFGWKPFIVLSGSMQAEINPGDIAVVKEIDTDELEVGDIIAYKTDDDIVITHRIEEVTIDEDGEKQFVTKGDNNDQVDSDVVTADQVEGIYVFKIDNLGNLAVFIQTPTGIIACLSIPIIILIIAQIVDSVNDRKYLKEQEEKEKQMQDEIKKLKDEKNK